MIPDKIHGLCRFHEAENICPRQSLLQNGQASVKDDAFIVHQQDVRGFVGAFCGGQQNGGELIHYVVNVDGEVLDSFSMSEQEDVTFSQDWSFTLNGELLLKRTLQEKSSFRDEIYAGTSDKGLGRIIALKQ